MSKKDEDYLDDPEIVDFNEELDARAARSMEEEEVPASPLMFGPTGRGTSPEMINKSPYELFRNASQALRNEGIKDDRHMKNTKTWDTRSEEQQQKEEAEEKQFDKMLDNMYNEMRKPVARSNTKLSSKKGGTRKRNKRSTRRRSTKRSTRRSTRRIRKSKRSKRSRRR